MDFSQPRASCGGGWKEPFQTLTPWAQATPGAGAWEAEDRLGFTLPADFLYLQEIHPTQFPHLFLASE